jgi:hypothetical protein
MSRSDVLEAAGWFEARAVDTSAQRSSIAERGYAVWPGVMTFLGEFSGLTLHFSRHQRNDTIWFDAELPRFGGRCNAW